MSESPKLILVLGGSTFMGKHLLHLLNPSPQYKTIYINRGRKYWNNHVKSFTNLNYYNGNREDHTEFTKLLTYISNKNGVSESKKWHCVVDFSAYKYTDIESVRNALEGLCELYVFVSTDSIYDVTKLTVGDDGHQQYTRIPELSQELKSKAKKDESYGYNKLKCEMYLQNHKDKAKFPYLSLILPDVVGPFDDTGRYWGYLKWISKQSPLEVDKEGREQKFSLAFSEDVVDLIHNIISGRVKVSEENLCESYNLGCKERVTLLGLLEMMCESVGKQLKYRDVSSAKSFYPSVDYGYLNTKKAEERLGWKPTDLKQMVRVTSKFFTAQGSKYTHQQQHAEKKLRKKLKTQ